MIDPEVGYWIGDAAAVEGLPLLAARCQELARTRLADAAWLKAMKKSSKPFYANVLQADDDLVAPLIAFARGPAMRAVLYHYFYPATPDLSHLGIFASGYEAWSPFRRPYRGTQVPHFDSGDPKHVKLFCYLTPVGVRDGPLTLWSAAVSAVHATGKARVEEIKLNGLQGVQVVGPAQTAAIVDTTRCIHYGSRTLGGHRVALVIHYCTDARRYSMRASEPFEDLNVAGISP